MYRFILEILTDPLGLPVNDLWEYGILAVIGLVAFAIGWEVSYSGTFGFVMYCVARLLTFFVLWAAMYVLLAAVQWVIAHLVLVCATILMAVAVMVIASITAPGHVRKQYGEVTA